jgi:hypothetical protein
VARILIHVLLAVATVVGAAAAGAAAVRPAPVSAAPAATVPTPSDPAPGGEAPVVTANPFIPENVDLTTCVGTLPRPGCGSEERGGLHQNLVAVAMIGGLVLIFGRVFWGVARGRRRETTETAPPTPDSTVP